MMLHPGAGAGYGVGFTGYQAAGGYPAAVPQCRGGAYAVPPAWFAAPPYAAPMQHPMMGVVSATPAWAATSACPAVGTSGGCRAPAASSPVQAQVRRVSTVGCPGAAGVSALSPRGAHYPVTGRPAASGALVRSVGRSSTVQVAPVVGATASAAKPGVRFQARHSSSAIPAVQSVQPLNQQVPEDGIEDDEADAKDMATMVTAVTTKKSEYWADDTVSEEQALAAAKLAVKMQERRGQAIPGGGRRR
eukprot:TRINITY_DN28956_c0_g1_i1.p1 TRINITY_DN28956_c0_g1~~TRINITY_DN28956_c0_g1_i1.p1  ORF type:complete len:247 (-),score=36.12 TRINITY_DN28956_c0_g1_i1:205-945(-)